MKTTIDIQDELLARAKRHARETGRPLRAVVEEGLRMVLETPEQIDYKLPDLSVGDPSRPDPLDGYSWSDLRTNVYHEP